MEIKIAEHAGFCFGVKRAVNSVYSLIEKGENRPVYTLGPIIHNERVIEDLAARGVHAIEDIRELTEPSIVIIRSHGVPESVILELEASEHTIFNATCPFVKKIHDVVREHSEAGEEIVIIGTASHPEVIGILGWSRSGGTVVETYEEAEHFSPKNPAGKVCVVAQTTFNSKKFQDFVEIFLKKEYDINVVDTICQATQLRQEEARRLSSESDAMLVIGGADSSNSRKLYEICKQQCENTFFIQTADAIEQITFDGFSALSITAGASTPNTLIQEVYEACQKK